MNEKAFVIGVSSGEYAVKSRYLVESLHRFHEDPEIYTFFREAQQDDFSEDEMDFFREHSTVLTGSIPIQEFPILMKTSALQAALDEAGAEWLVLLDADLLLTGPFDLDLPDDADIVVKPEDISSYYWGRDESWDDWKDLHERYDVPLPEEGTTATVDGVESRHPLYNAGVVALRRSLAEDFVPRWQDITVELYGELREPWFTQQLVFDLLTCDHAVEELPERYNFPLAVSYYCPAGTRVLHYHIFEQFRTLMHPDVRRAVKESGIMQEVPLRGIIHSYYTPFKFRMRSVM